MDLLSKAVRRQHEVLLHSQDPDIRQFDDFTRSAEGTPTVSVARPTMHNIDPVHSAAKVVGPALLLVGAVIILTPGQL